MEPTPIPVPEELRALAAHDPVIVSALRDARVAIEERSGLDERTIELVRLGTLVALGAPEGSLGAHVRRARAGGVSERDVWDTVAAVSTLVGVPRLIGAVPAIAAALETARG